MGTIVTERAYFCTTKRCWFGKHDLKMWLKQGSFFFWSTLLCIALGKAQSLQICMQKVVHYSFCPPPSQHGALSEVSAESVYNPVWMRHWKKIHSWQSKRQGKKTKCRNFPCSFDVFVLRKLLVIYSNCQQRKPKLIAGSLESANWSILAARRFFKEVVGKKIRILC